MKRQTANNLYLTTCVACGMPTSKQYARNHEHKCKACFTGEPKQSNTPSREQRILEHGYQAYAREEGHYGD